MANSRGYDGTVTFCSRHRGRRAVEAHPTRCAMPGSPRRDLSRDRSRNNGVISNGRDAVCAAFERQMMHCGAVESQRQLTGHVWPTTSVSSAYAWEFIPHGEERDDDYFGPAVNRVARFMSIAHGGRFSFRATHELLRHASIDVMLRELGEHASKTSASRSAFQVVAAGLLADFPSLTSLDAQLTTCRRQYRTLSVAFAN